MSPPKVILFQIILTFFILGVKSFIRFYHTCDKGPAGINSLKPVTKIPGRYSSKYCYNLIPEGDSINDGTLYVHIEFIKDKNEEQCKFKLGENTVYHSALETFLTNYRRCSVVCEDKTFDLIVNGCYKTTLQIVDDDFKPKNNNMFSPSYQYIKDSKDASYFDVKPSIAILYDRSNYIDVTWHTGNIPINNYELKLCHHKNYHNSSEFKDCATIEFCQITDTYTISCRNDRLSMFAVVGPKMLVFQHKNPYWGLGMFKDYSTAIYELGDGFDVNKTDIIKGTPYYLTANLTKVEVTTPKADTTSPQGGEMKSGASGAIISCVVITVLLVVAVVVVRLLHVRGHLRQYYNPSFSFLNPLSNNESDRTAMVQ